MMLTLIFDTETTGLPPKNDSAPLEKCPWIIQLAAVVYNGRTPVSYFSSYVRPEFGDARGEIPNEKFWIENHLTYSEIMPTAVSLPAALRIFEIFSRGVDRVVAHNTQFDVKQLSYSFRRVYGDKFAQTVPFLCTMLSSMPIVALPAKWPKPDQPYKWPTLDEAYRKLVSPAGFVGAHDALADVQACAAVLFALEDAGHPLVAI